MRLRLVAAVLAVVAAGACGSTSSSTSAGAHGGPNVSRAGGTTLVGRDATTGSTAAVDTGSPAAGLPPPAGRGIVRGVVTAGPTCPVQRADHPCPPRPLVVDVIGRDTHGAEAARARSAADGSFTMTLLPGYYELEVVTTDAMMRCPATGVDVFAGGTTRADIACDTGIR